LEPYLGGELLQDGLSGVQGVEGERLGGAVVEIELVHQWLHCGHSLQSADDGYIDRLMDEIDTDFDLLDAGRHPARQAEALRQVLQAELSFGGGHGALQLVAITDMLQIRQQMLKSTPNRLAIFVQLR
jgi:hypothetical protein